MIRQTWEHMSSGWKTYMIVTTIIFLGTFLIWPFGSGIHFVLFVIFTAPIWWGSS